MDYLPWRSTSLLRVLSNKIVKAFLTGRQIGIANCLLIRTSHRCVSPSPTTSCVRSASCGSSKSLQQANRSGENGCHVWVCLQTTNYQVESLSKKIMNAKFLRPQSDTDCKTDYQCYAQPCGLQSGTQCADRRLAQLLLEHGENGFS